MDIRKLQRAIVDGLEDVKGQHIAVFNTEHLSSMFERVIIASGTSNRQTKALAASVRDSVKKGGMQVMATEGEDNGEWIIVDCGAAVAHIMQPAIREYYHLEEIWGGKTVRMKVGEVSTKLVKASESMSIPGIGRSSAAKTAYKAALAGADKPVKAAVKSRPKRDAGTQRAAPVGAKRTAGTAAPALARTHSRTPAKTGSARATGTRSAPTSAPVRTVEKAVAKTAAKSAPTSAPRSAPILATKSAVKPAAKSAIKTIVVKPPAPRKIATKTVARKTPVRKSGQRR